MGPDRNLAWWQIALVTGGYLGAVLVSLILFDSHWPNGSALLIWTAAAVLLGLVTGRFAFALLAFAAIPIAIPFGAADELTREPPPLWFVAIFLAVYASILTTVAVLARLGVEYLQRRRAASV